MNKSNEITTTTSAESAGVVKRPESGALVDTSTSSGPAFSGAHQGYANEIGVMVDYPPAENVSNYVRAEATAERLHIGGGLALIKARADSKHGEFEQLLKSFGIPSQRASEHMAIAHTLANASPDDRKRLLGQPKTVLIGMARMDDEVRAELLATGKLNERLTLSEYRELVSDKDRLIASLESREKALNAELARSRLTGKAALDLATPLTVVQVRRDAATLALTAQEAVHDFAVLIERTTSMGTTVKDEQWSRATGVSLVSALLGLRAVLDDQVHDAITAFGLDTEVPPRLELSMAVPGPEEAELIHTAMEGVMVAIDRERAKRKYDAYVEQRERTPTKGAYMKDPSAADDNNTASRKRR